MIAVLIACPHFFIFFFDEFSERAREACKRERARSNGKTFPCASGQ